MEANDIFIEIVDKFKLGDITASVERVTGGYMHKMYRLETSTGKYAIKLLNPVIMARSDAFENYKTAEYLEGILQDNHIPIIPALTFGNEKMQRINDQYLYIFDWIYGKALISQKIKQEHCEIIGSLLAKIHKIKRIHKTIELKQINIDWDYYVLLANDKCIEIVDILMNNKELLYKSQNNGNIALKNIPDIAVISNGDMDSKNVLWVNNNPKIIDLECLNYGNPYMELFQLALCWSGYEHCQIDFSLLTSFIQ